MDPIREILHVHVDNKVSLERPVPKERVMTFQTYIAGPVPQLILPHSPKRVGAQIVVLGVIGTNSNVLLGKSEGDVSTALAATGDVYQGAGMTLPPSNQPMPLDGTTEVWMAAIGAGTAPLVSVMRIVEKD
jgi:hypothetical protein